jgi:hypothetical protein
MRFTRLMRVCGALIVGGAAVSRPAFGQTRSATVRVSAYVVDVAALAPMAADPSEAPAPGAASTTAAAAVSSGQPFSVVPPRHSPVAVSMRVRGAREAGREGMSLQVCRPSEAHATLCRRLPFSDASGDRHAAAVTDQPVFVRLVGLADSATAATQVTVTLAYPGT